MEVLDLAEMVESINRSVREAATQLNFRGLGLKEDTRGAFDGEGWVWTWRQISEQKLDDPVPETLLRVRPDPMEDGFEIHIVGGAWIPKRRDVAAGRTYYAEYFETLPPPSTLTSRLKEHLRRAWEGAVLTAQQLPSIERNRRQVIKELHQDGLLADEDGQK